MYSKSQQPQFLIPYIKEEQQLHCTARPSHHFDAVERGARRVEGRPHADVKGLRRAWVRRRWGVGCGVGQRDSKQ